MQTPKILLVEDETDTLETIKRYMDRAIECEIAKASDGKEALAKIENETFDLVILDLHMPEMTGIETMKQAKMKKQLPDIIVVTAYDSTEMMRDAIKAGAVDYMPKPLDLEKLLLKIKSVLAKKGKYFEKGN